MHGLSQRLESGVRAEVVPDEQEKQGPEKSQSKDTLYGA